MKTASDVFKAFDDAQVTSVHLSPNKIPFVRRNGKTIKLESDAGSIDPIPGIITELLEGAGICRKDVGHGIYCKYQNVQYFVREISAQGLKEVSINRLPSAQAKLSEIGLPEELATRVGKKKTLIIQANVDNSRVSNSITALINHAVEREELHVIHVDLPLARPLEQRLGIITQVEVGIDTESFETAIRDLCNVDADILAIGKLPSKSSLVPLVECATAGRCVIIGMEARDMSSLLVDIIQLSDREDLSFRMRFLDVFSFATLQTTIKKPEAGSTLSALEIFTGTTNSKKLLLEGKFAKIADAMRVMEKDGMQSLEVALANLVRNDKIDRKTAFEYARNKDLLKNELGSNQG